MTAFERSAKLACTGPRWLKAARRVSHRERSQLLPRAPIATDSGGSQGNGLTHTNA
ncbi:hypothetical protein R5W24_005101 [Gemmata sp. JC717]|uniref:hypothetical protein n=1 Tax=Gemmata algarum TaxID=2975278 RepID=UPI0021BB861A|nr:hypothetical protein [Gemmata algarum]MDY3555955.1 hypothetical protein [Gemmata algarum]